MMKKNWIARELTTEMIVGAFIVMILLGMGYFTIILSRETWFSKKYIMEVVFNDVVGLQSGDKVVARGMPIGKISDLKMRGDRSGVCVILSLDEKLHMKKDYIITIVSTSILGGRYLQIYEGSPDNPDLPDGSFFRGRETHDLMADMAELVNAVKEGVIEGGVIENLKTIFSNIREITDKINNGEGTLGKLLSKDDKVYNDLSDIVTSFKSITGDVEKGKGLLGKLIRDDSLYGEAEGLIEEVRSAVDDFRETSPIVTFTSIFFGAF